MSNQDSNDSDIDNTVVENLSTQDDNNQQSKSIQIESDTATTGTISTTPNFDIPIAEDENAAQNLSATESCSSSSGSPKLTAEWSVNAQLTFRNAKLGENVKKESNSNSTSNTDSNNPVKVFYKWSSSNVKNNENNLNIQGNGIATTTTKLSTSKIPLRTKKNENDKKHRDSLEKGQFESFRSTATTADSGNCSNQSKKPPKYGTRCRSTCNIVLSAVADFLSSPKNNTTSDTKPFTFNATAKYSASPEKDIEGSISKKISQKKTSITKVASLRDAFSQTSDTEIKDSDSFQIVDPNVNGGKGQKSYQERRHTDSVMLTPHHQKSTSLPVKEGNSFLPSLQTHKSPSLPKIPPLPTQMLQPLTNQTTYSSTLESGLEPLSKSEIKRPPRTVHIDVYCTGSDEEDDGDDDDEDEDDFDFSISSEESKHDMESNSTPQTVLDNEQMLLTHQRSGKNNLPRKFLNQQQLLKQQQQALYKSVHSPTNDSNIKPTNPKFLNSTQEEIKPEITLNIGHAITKSTTAEEINESKQLLFKKHIGDQRNNKITIRNSKHIHRDISDDAISSNYPNSSRSTMRDMTCSSISSKAMSSFDMESSWKETEVSVARTDSFDYDNTTDRMRIQNMEKLWRGPSTEKQLYQHNDFYQGESQRPSYRSIQPSPETPSFKSISQQKLHPGSNQNPQTAFRNDLSQNYNLNSKNYFCSSPQGHSYVTSPQQPYPSPGGQSYAQNLSNYNSTPQPYLGPIHPPLRSISPNQNRIQQFIQGCFPGNYPTKSWQPHQEVAITSEYELFPESNTSTNYYGFKNQTIPERDEPANSNYNCNNNSSKFVQEIHTPSQQSSNQKYSTMPQYLSHQFSRAQRYGSEDRSPFDFPDRKARVMFTADYNKSGSESSTLQSNLSGYTTEYLAKARRFGSVVTQMRKPGHHIGPAKNPDCECEHCKRWFNERLELKSAGEGRGRAYSMGDTPKGIFWLRRSHN